MFLIRQVEETYSWVTMRKDMKYAPRITSTSSLFYKKWQLIINLIFYIISVNKIYLLSFCFPSFYLSIYLPVINFSTYLMLCLVTMTHDFKWVKMYYPYICLISHQKFQYISKLVFILNEPDLT